MFVSRESPPLLLAVAVLLALVAQLAEADMRETAGTLRRSVSLPALAWLGALFLFCAVSLSWSGNPVRGAAYLAQAAGSIVSIALALALIPQHLTERAFLAAAALAVIAALLLVPTMLTDGAFRGALGMDNNTFRVNRLAVALALFWPLLTPALARWKTARAACMVTLVFAVGIFVSESQSAKLAFLASLAVFALARFWPRATLHLVGGGTVLLVIAAPVLFGHLNAMLPQAVHDILGESSSYIRGEIWREFTQLLWHRPLLGFGFAGSETVLMAPEAAGLSLLSRGYLEHVHPHNIPLHIWFELGAVGAALTLVLVCMVWRSLARLPQAILPNVTALAAAVVVVSLVSHGAWQAWWHALVGIMAVWAAALVRQARAPAT